MSDVRSAMIPAEEAARVARMVLLTPAARDATPMQRGDMVAAALEQLAALAPRDAPPGVTTPPA